MTGLPENHPRPAFIAGRPRGGHDSRPEGPRKVKHGLKLRGKDQQSLRSGMAGRWMSLASLAIGDEAMHEGLQYAQAGQTIFMEIHSGVVEGSVQGSAVKPYSTSLRLPPLTDAQWDRLIESMAGEAIYAAKLLAHELPPGLDALMASLDMELLPESSDAFRCECTCTNAKPCKHAATLAHLYAQDLVEDPLLIFTLRGLPRERLLNRLRQARAIQAHGVAAAHGDALLPDAQGAAPPLEQCMDDFWRPATPLEELTREAPPHHVPHALLRRLGPSPLNGKFPLVGLLASVYDTVSAAAKKMRENGDDSASTGSS